MQVRSNNKNDDASDDKTKENIQRSLCNDILQHIRGRRNDSDKVHNDIPLEIMFESCILQQTGSLAFHCDKLHCPANDRTFAALIPAGNKKDCLTSLYNSQKSVTDHVTRMTTIHKTIGDVLQCPLLRLTLKCVFGWNNIFDYQETLYENENSLQYWDNTLK
jgi:hypothetical protein